MDERRSRQGLICGLLAYGLWGLFPLYFRQLEHMPPLEVVAHRIVWSFVLLAGLITIMGRWPAAWLSLCNRRVLALLSASTVLIAANWLTYIFSVFSHQVLQSSLGYFITPLAQVLLGVVVLGERLRKPQLAAVALALVGVSYLTIAGGQFPWIALTLAATFALYALVRKTVPLDGLLSLLIETMLLAPISLAFLLVGAERSGSHFQPEGGNPALLLMLSGPITAVPLLLFGAAARRLRLSTLGVLQYLAPTLQFFLAVLVFGEPFDRPRLFSFVLIWTAVAIYTWDSIRAYRSSSLAVLLRTANDYSGASARTPAATQPVEG